MLKTKIEPVKPPIKINNKSKKNKKIENDKDEENEKDDKDDWTLE